MAKPTNYPNVNLAKSAAAFEEAKRYLVGGTNSPVRSFKRVGGHPVIMQKGEGAFLTDIDNNTYIDFVMSYGPHLFGHAEPSIVRAVTEAVGGSSCLGFTTEAEVEWAKKVFARLPHAALRDYRIRALSSGTEACATAIRLARGVTNRNIILKCAGHYHGHVDSLLVDAGSGVATLSSEAVPDSKGIPKALTDLSRIVTFNDPASLDRVFAEHGSDLAALIFEPVMGNMGVVPPTLSFLKRARELCTEHGALLIADEVMTGLRVNRESAHGLYGFEPDLICLGKVVGGGLPLAALVGPAKFMEQLAPLGAVYQAGTLSGNPIGIRAGIAMLDLIDQMNPYPRLEAIGGELQKVVQAAALDRGIPLVINRVGAMISFFFRTAPVTTASDCRDVDHERFNKFFWALLNEGIMIPPSPFEALFISTAHEMVFDQTFRTKIDRVLDRLTQ